MTMSMTIVVTMMFNVSGSSLGGGDYSWSGDGATDMRAMINGTGQAGWSDLWSGEVVGSVGWSYEGVGSGVVSGQGGTVTVSVDRSTVTTQTKSVPAGSTLIAHFRARCGDDGKADQKTLHY